MNNESIIIRRANINDIDNNLLNIFIDGFEFHLNGRKDIFDNNKKNDDLKKETLEKLKDSILKTLANEYVKKNSSSVGLNALQHYRKEYGMEIQDDEIKKQYSNYLQNALASIASANSSTTK